MARPKNLIRPTRLSTSIPADLRWELDRYLAKQKGGVIPVGAYQKFLVNLLKAFFSSKEKEK